MLSQKLRKKWNPGQPFIQEDYISSKVWFVVKIFVFSCTCFFYWRVLFAGRGCQCIKSAVASGLFYLVSRFINELLISFLCLFWCIYISKVFYLFLFFKKLVLAISVLLSKFKGNRLKGCKQKDYFFLCPPFSIEQDSFFNPSFSSELTNWHLGIQNYKTFHL